MENRIEKRITRDEVRALQDETGKRFIEGYAILYNHRSKLICEWGGEFYEIISERALDEVMSDPELDVIYTPNHNYDQVVGRTKSGTLKLVNDERGLKYIVEVPNTTYANDLYESIKRGDIFESSFTFYTDKNDESWEVDQDGNNIRIVNKISILKEVSSVTWGAYTDTEVAARSLKEFREKQEPEKPKDEVKEPVNPLINYKYRLNLIKLKK